MILHLKIVTLYFKIVNLFLVIVTLYSKCYYFTIVKLRFLVTAA